MASRKPKIVILADSTNWAFDYAARSIARQLRDDFEIRVAYSAQKPSLDPATFDLIYIFYWADEWHKGFSIPAHKIVREVASFRWNEKGNGALQPSDFAERYLLQHSNLVTVPCRKLFDSLAPYVPEVFHCPKGYEPAVFRPRRKPAGPLRIGWVGRPSDPSKGLHDVLVPACRGRFHFRYSTGNWSRWQTAHFYNEIDVIAIASTAESQPLPLIEGMASGCFPVATDVGIVPELVESGANGLIVERNVEAFQAAFSWCNSHLQEIREAGLRNARSLPESRGWSICAKRFREVLNYAVSRATEAAVVRPVARVDSGLRLYSKELQNRGKRDLVARNGTLSAPQRLLGALHWRLSDLGAQASWLSAVLRREGWMLALSRRLCSPAWWWRRLR